MHWNYWLRKTISHSVKTNGSISDFISAFEPVWWRQHLCQISSMYTEPCLLRRLTLSESLNHSVTSLGLVCHLLLMIQCSRWRWSFYYFESQKRGKKSRSTAFVLCPQIVFSPSDGRGQAKFFSHMLVEKRTVKREIRVKPVFFPSEKAVSKKFSFLFFVLGSAVLDFIFRNRANETKKIFILFWLFQHKF